MHCSLYLRSIAEMVAARWGHYAETRAPGAYVVVSMKTLPDQSDAV